MELDDVTALIGDGSPERLRAATERLDERARCLFRICETLTDREEQQRILAIARCTETVVTLLRRSEGEGRISDELFREVEEAIVRVVRAVNVHAATMEVTS